MKTFFPYSLQDKKRNSANRFDDYDRQREHNSHGTEAPSTIMNDAPPTAAQTENKNEEEKYQEMLKQFTDPQASFKIDKHNKMTYQHIEKDIKGKSVLHLAEERIGQDLEKIR